MRRALVLSLGGAAVAAPLPAQEPEQGADEGRIVIDLTLPTREPQPDPLLDQQCEEEADAARIAGEIIVCRKLPEDDSSGFDQRDFERRYAAATPGDRTPNVDGTGVQLPAEGSLFTVTVTMKVGQAPEPPLMIDVTDLPEAPPGSDADRAARGLPPLED